MTSTLRAFAKVATLVAVVLAVAGLFEAFNPFGMTAGFYLTLAEFLMGLFCIGIATAKHRREKIPYRGFFIISLALIVIGDLTFYYLNYYLQTNMLTEVYSIITSACFGVAYLLVSIALVKSSGLAFQTHLKKFLMPAVIVAIIAAYYFMPAFYQDALELNLVSNFIRIFSVATTTLLAAIAMTTLIQSINPLIVLTSLGFSILALVNYAISSEILRHGAAKFGFYEFLWATGLFLAEGALVYYYSLKERQEISPRRSISVQYRTAIIFVVTVLLIGASLFSLAIDVSIKTVTVGVIVGMIAAILVSAMTVESVTYYSSMLGRYLERGFVGDSKNAQVVQQLPIELEMLFSSVFAANLENVSRSRRLHEKLAHDIRTPLMVMKSMAANDALKEAVASLQRVSNSILGDIEVPTTSAVSARAVAARSAKSLESIRQIPVAVNADGDNAYYVWIDEALLERALNNLLSNAFESQAVSAVRVTIARRAERVSIEVEDNGKGATQDVIQKLNQATRVTTKATGHGLGLSNLSADLRQKGCDIEFESVEGKYFKATLVLPAASARIVLIDDDKAVHLAWKALAMSKKIEIKNFNETHSLEEIVQAVTPSDELYVDLHLGQKSGLELIRQLRERGLAKAYLTTSESRERIDGLDASIVVRDKSFPRV